LITGITGLLGQYFLCDSLIRREPIGVLVRERRGISAADRVDRLLAPWEKRLGRYLPRPVILNGDLRQKQLGLSRSSAAWMRKHVSSVLHSAASVSFQETKSGEPMTSNVEGTRHLLEFCRSSQVRDFHYISTAYSCGQVKNAAHVYEQLHPLEGPFGNIYERSKCLAEHLVNDCTGNFSRTIYRPSIIVGESATGISPSFNAIYTPVKLIWMLLRDTSASIPSAGDLLAQLNLRGDEARNVVPVDWVCQTIGAIVRTPQHHGGVYHITNSRQTAGSEIISAIISALNADRQQSGDASLSAPSVSRMTLSDFREHMQPYRSYFASDPSFDISRLQATGVVRDCPVVDGESLARAFRYGIDQKFATRESIPMDQECMEPRCRLDGLVGQLCESTDMQTNRDPLMNPDDLPHTDHQVLTARATARTDSEKFDAIELSLSGPGGGLWNVGFGQNEIIVSLPKHDGDDTVRFYGSAVAFRAWMRGSLSLEQGLHAGAFILTGTRIDQTPLYQALEELRLLLSRDDLDPIGIPSMRLPLVRDLLFAGTDAN
jgi:thioester reductase-like protein